MIGILRTIFDDDILNEKINTNHFENILTVDDCKNKVKQSSIYLSIINHRLNTEFILTNLR